MTATSDFVLTFDIDWAPDFVIDRVAQPLIEHRVKATWFVTHRSAAIERLRQDPDLFELGIHPNMLAGSTHGASEDEVLAHVKELVPDAVTMRTHGLYQTSRWLVKAARDFGIRHDVSLYLPRAGHLRAHQITWNGSSLWRIPYFWEDDSEMFENRPIWRTSDARLHIPGLRVVDFHPIHIALNTQRLSDYDELKSLRPVNSWDEAFVDEHEQTGDGPRSFFEDLVRDLAGRGRCIRDIVAQKEPE